MLVCDFEYTAHVHYTVDYRYYLMLYVCMNYKGDPGHRNRSYNKRV